MATFNWDVKDASGRKAKVCSCGEVFLADLQLLSGSRLDIMEADPGISIDPESGGKIEEIITRKEFGVNSSSITGSLNLNNKFVQRTIFIIVFALLLSFLLVVVASVIRGQLDFQTYMIGLASFLAGLGMGKLKNHES